MSKHDEYLRTAWTYFSKCSTLEDGKAAFRELSKRWHPDRPGGREPVMKAINEMWELVKAHHSSTGKMPTEKPRSASQKRAAGADFWEEMKRRADEAARLRKEAQQRAERQAEADRRAAEHARQRRQNEQAQASRQASSATGTKGQKTASTFSDVAGQSQAEIDAAILVCLAQLGSLPKTVLIERAGDWLWISGDTKPHRETLKTAGCQWSPKKEKWYFAGRKVKGGRKGGKAWEDIKAKYGAESVR